MLKLTQSEFKVLNILNSASKILGFQLFECILPIVNSVAILFSDMEDLVEITLSIICNYLKPYLFTRELNKVNKLH